MNNIIFEDSLCKIEIISKKFGIVYALIDKEDYSKVKNLTWCLDGYGYVVSKVGGRKNSKYYKLHRLVLDVPQHLYVDHIAHNKLDNRKKYLRACTHKNNLRNQNIQNRENKSSIYKGVTWDKNRNKWMARIKIDGKTVNLGRTKTEIEAAKKYNMAAISLFGEYALINKLEQI